MKEAKASIAQTEEAAGEELEALEKQITALEGEKATMTTERVEWEEMITEEVTSLETQLAEAQLAGVGGAEQLAAMQSAFALLQEEKSEGDEYLAEFEAASIEESAELQGKLDAALAGKAAAEASAAGAEADAEAAMEEMSLEAEAAVETAGNEYKAKMAADAAVAAATLAEALAAVSNPPHHSLIC